MLLGALLLSEAKAQVWDSVQTRELQTVNVTEKRKPAVLRSPVPLQVLDAGQIRRLGYQDAGDAVRRFAGVGVRDYGGIGGLKTISVRSLGPHHTAVTYDGVAVGNVQAGQIDLGRFPLDNLAQISLTVGQSADIFQPARLAAFGSVLAFQTERFAPVNGSGQCWALNLKAGSFGFANPFLRYGRRLSERALLSVESNYRRADGRYPFTLVNGDFVSREKRQNTAVNEWNSEANLYHTFRDSSSLSLKASYSRSDRELPGSVILYNPAGRRERLREQHVLVQGGYEKQYESPWRLKGLFKYNRAYSEYREHDAKYEGGVQEEKHRQQEFYGSGMLLFTPVGRIAFSGASDLTVNTLHSGFYPLREQAALTHPVRYTSQTSLSFQYLHERFSLTGTLLSTWITEQAASGETPDDRYRFTPSLSFSFRPWTSRSLRFRILYKQAYRVPTFNDLYYLRIGNLKLKAESAREYGAGATWSGKGLPFTSYIALTVDGYYNNVRDKITAIPTTYIWKMQNTGKVRIWGADLTLKMLVPLGDRSELSLSGSYTRQRAEDVTDPSASYYKHQLPYTPEHSGSGAVSVAFPWATLSYTVIGAGERYVNKENVAMYRLPGYGEHTISLHRELEAKYGTWRLQAELINLTDEQYAIIQYYPMPGRSFRVSATCLF